MKKTLKIGTNRGKPRIWIEGAALSSNGWNNKVNFQAHFEDGKIVYEQTWDGPRAVAGKPDRPIIDTCTPKILECLGDDATHAEIEVTEYRITITKGTPPPKKGALAMTVAVIAAVSSLAAPYLSQFKRGAMRVLVACEESATVRDQFALRGHDAVSADILDTRNPYGWHHKGDVTPLLDKEWDLVLGFPPCTYLTISAAYAFKDPDFDRYPGVGYHQRLRPGTLFGEDRRRAREEAIEFVKTIYDSADRVCIENPKGFLSTMWMKPTQMIHPHWFGDAESKETCLWLKNLPPLEPTDRLDVKEHGYLVKSGQHTGKWRWPNQSPCGAPKMGPSDSRAKDKSVTYHGVAVAMAEQWS
jgi:hypothetical protein